jgi:catechol 2,3-dioxygenase-like lactoylglutathione lyase family enzyme
MGAVQHSGPPTWRWTHIALPSSDLDASIRWYEEFTPLVLLDRREDADGQSAWLSHHGQVDNPFVLVLVMFFRDQGRKQPMLAPFAHIGVEVPNRADVDAIAEKARAAGCLTWEPTDMPDPIGYICAITDPDGNVIEISHNQGVYDKVQEVWGSASAPA